MQGHEPSGGVRMVLPGFLTLMASRMWRSRFGMKRSTTTTKSILFFSLTHSSDFLKERLFGLSNPQGNHGESIKEAHFHLDNTPTVKSSLYFPCAATEICYSTRT